MHVLCIREAHSFISIGFFNPSWTLPQVLHRHPAPFSTCAFRTSFICPLYHLSLPLSLSLPSSLLRFCLPSPSTSSLLDLRVLRLFGNPLEFFPEILPCQSLRHLSLANVRVVSDMRLKHVDVTIEVTTHLLFCTNTVARPALSFLLILSLLSLPPPALAHQAPVDVQYFKAP